MARTIAEIQQEILDQKNEVDQLNALQVLTPNEKQTLEGSLTSTSKTAIWRLWVYIVATAIWMHEKIVLRNAAISRPHTLNWYREQAFNYIAGEPLIWKDGFFQFDLDNIVNIEEKQIIKHVAISERLYEDVLRDLNDSDAASDASPPERDTAALIREYYYNQVGIVTLKVAKRNNTRPTRLEPAERIAFERYLNQIKDAGTQIRVLSTTGDKIRIEIEVYVDPLIIYTEGENIGKLIKDLSRKPVEDSTRNYLETLEFNGAFVPTFLLDNIQKEPGVRLPILRKITITPFGKKEGFVVYNDSDNFRESPFFVPTSGYFDTGFDQQIQDADPPFQPGTEPGIFITYFPYNLQTDSNFNL